MSILCQQQENKDKNNCKEIARIRNSLLRNVAYSSCTFKETLAVGHLVEILALAEEIFEEHP